MSSLPGGKTPGQVANALVVAHTGQAHKRVGLQPNGRDEGNGLFQIGNERTHPGRKLPIEANVDAVGDEPGGKLGGGAHIQQQRTGFVHGPLKHFGVKGLLAPRHNGVNGFVAFFVKAGILGKIGGGFGEAVQHLGHKIDFRFRPQSIVK